MGARAAVGELLCAVAMIAFLAGFPIAIFLIGTSR